MLLVVTIKWVLSPVEAFLKIGVTLLFRKTGLIEVARWEENEIRIFFISCPMHSVIWRFIVRRLIFQKTFWRFRLHCTIRLTTRLKSTFSEFHGIKSFGSSQKIEMIWKLISFLRNSRLDGLSQHLKTLIYFRKLFIPVDTRRRSLQRCVSTGISNSSSLWPFTSKFL